MPRTDFDGDGRDDVIWRHSQTGVVTSWLAQANGSFVHNAAAGFDPWAASGTFNGTGDFNGDGRSDTVWRNANGELFLSLTDPEGAFYFYWNLGFVADVPDEWNVVGTGDFNGDGRDDLLLRHTNGSLTNWLGQADWGFVSNQAQANYALPIGWHVSGTGDFNGDGRDDLLLRHDNGTVTNWLGEANGGFASNHAIANYALPLGWHIAGTGDFNGDGFEDVLLRHDGGTVTEWLGQADGSFFSNHAIANYTLPTGWSVASTGDFNGDGRDDVLLRHDNGTVTNWLGQVGGAFFSNHAVANYAVELVWQIQPNLSGAGLWDY